MKTAYAIAIKAADAAYSTARAQGATEAEAAKRASLAYDSALKNAKK